MIDAMKRDYLDGCAPDPVTHGLTIKHLESYRVSLGRKYARVFSGPSVKAFVVLVDNDKKFRKGDILKPASYAAPARNAARGNVLDGGYLINWTGPTYL